MQLKSIFKESDQILYEKAVKASFLNARIYGALYTIADATPYLTENPYVSSAHLIKKRTRYTPNSGLLYLLMNKKFIQIEEELATQY